MDSSFAGGHRGTAPTLPTAYSLLPTAYSLLPTAPDLARQCRAHSCSSTAPVIVGYRLRFFSTFSFDQISSQSFTHSAFSTGWKLNDKG